MELNDDAKKYAKWLKEHYNLRQSTIDLYMINVNAFLNTDEPISYDSISKFLLTYTMDGKKERTKRNYARKQAIIKYLLYKGHKKLNEELMGLYKSLRMAGDTKYEKEITNIDMFVAYIDSLELRHRALLMCMFDTGCRIQAMLKLTPKDVVREGKDTFIRLREGRRVKKTLYRLIEPQTAHYLTSYINSSPHKYPFRGKYTQKKAYQKLYSWLKNSSRKFGLVDPDHGHGISFHWLRTTRARQLYKRYKDILKVKTFLGHKDIATTMRYIEEGKDISAKIVKSEHKWE